MFNVIDFRVSCNVFLMKKILIRYMYMFNYINKYSNMVFNIVLWVLKRYEMYLNNSYGFFGKLYF